MDLRCFRLAAAASHAEKKRKGQQYAGKWFVFSFVHMIHLVVNVSCCRAVYGSFRKAEMLSIVYTFFILEGKIIMKTFSFDTAVKNGYDCNKAKK